MLDGYNPIIQTLIGTLFTWGLTAAGAGLVFFLQSSQRKILDGSLGFAAGVMTAASYWSLLDPAIEIAKHSGQYGANGEFAFLPAGVGFLLGALFVYGADLFIDWMGISSHSMVDYIYENKAAQEELEKICSQNSNNTVIGFPAGDNINFSNDQNIIHRRKAAQLNENFHSSGQEFHEEKHPFEKRSSVSWRRLLMMIIAITVHNIPEGLAVGVGFAAVNKSVYASFDKARNLALGIGIQNFPEGLAVSLPLRGAGLSKWKSFWYGQLSGMVEPVAGLLGAFLLNLAEPLLPYALAFAAGAMIYVVVDDIIPEAHTCGNGTLCSWGAVIGFWIMMSLDVGLA